MSRRRDRAFPDPERRRTNVGRRLIDAFQAFEQRIVQGLHESGFRDFRSTHGACLRNLDLDGTSVTELARRARMTKQAMSLLVQELEKIGYVRRTPHRSDGRSKIVVFTPKGRRLITAGQKVNDKLDREWKKALGASGFEQLLQLLDRVPSTGISPDRSRAKGAARVSHHH